MRGPTAKRWVYIPTLAICNSSDPSCGGATNTLFDVFHTINFAER